MRRLALLVLATLLVVPVTVSVAAAADITTGMLLMPSKSVFYCLVNDTSPRYKVTVRVQMIDFAGNTVQDIGPEALLPGTGTWVGQEFTGGAAYCRVTTSSPGYTRAMLAATDTTGTSVIATSEAR